MFNQDSTSILPRDALISRAEIAKRWGVSVETIKRREREGLIHPLRFNSRLLRYKLSAIEQIEAEASQRPTARSEGAA